MTICADQINPRSNSTSSPSVDGLADPEFLHSPFLRGSSTSAAGSDSHRNDSPLVISSDLRIFHSLVRYGSLLVLCEFPQIPTPPLVHSNLFRLRCHFNYASPVPLHPHDSSLDFSTAPNLQEVMIDTLTMSLVDFILPWGSFVRSPSTARMRSRITSFTSQTVSRCSRNVTISLT